MAQPGTGSRFESFGRKVDEYIGRNAPGFKERFKERFEEPFRGRSEGQFEERVEAEVKKVIAYLNDEVVPEVRRNSSEALRTASEHLRKLAEHLDRNSKPRS